MITVLKNSPKLLADPAPVEIAPKFALIDTSGATIGDQVVLFADFNISGEATLSGQRGDNFGVTLRDWANAAGRSRPARGDSRSPRRAQQTAHDC